MLKSLTHSADRQLVSSAAACSKMQWNLEEATATLLAERTICCCVIIIFIFSCKRSYETSFCRSIITALVKDTGEEIRLSKEFSTILFEIKLLKMYMFMW